MVVEWQRIRVRPEDRERYVRADAEVVLVIRWRSRDHWEGIPDERLKEMEERFRREVPDDAREVLECRAYEPSSAG